MWIHGGVLEFVAALPKEELPSHGGGLEGVAALPREQEGRRPSLQARGSGFQLVCRLTCLNRTSLERQPVQAESSKTTV
jgi:hypothetical protein